MRLGTIIAGLLLLSSAYGQVEPPDSSLQRENAIRVFIDCFYCDMNFIREEIPYVNYVRDIKDAQIYIREAIEKTGGGGIRYTYFFNGQIEFKGKNDTLVYTTSPDDTQDIIRSWRTQMLEMGLMSYVARTPLYKELVIVPTEKVESQDMVDNWDNWVFSLMAQPNFSGEESWRNLSMRSSLSATRITHDWKLEFKFDYLYSRTKYTYNNTLYTNEKNNKVLDFLLVKSMGEHWSSGIKTDILSSTYNNYNFLLKILPSIEYNYFPYSKSTHHQLRILYGLGGSFRNYNEITIFEKTEELLWLHQLQVAFQVQEKWGSIGLSLEGSNYFHDFSKNRLVLNGIMSFRIIKGLSVYIIGSAARINDQLSLVAGDASEAEILLQLQELQTSFNVMSSVGITYTFGSIYNNIVNPRFGNGTW